MKRNKIVTILIVIVTIILAGIAIFTAIRLYQLRKESVAPTAPEKSEAQISTPSPTYEACSAFSFTISTPAPGVCNSTCVTNSDCASASTTSATDNVDLTCYQPPFVCPTGENCIDVMPPKVCRNVACPTESDCVCSTSTAKPTATPTSTPTPTPTGTAGTTPTPTTPTGTSSPISQTTSTPEAGLPVAGTAFPTLIGIGAGIILLILSIALAI